jgi:hypothetical protein
MSVDKVCSEFGIPSTKTQLDYIKRERTKVEHHFWKNGINKILEGFTEEDFED